MSGLVTLAEVTDLPLDLARHIGAVDQPHAGATVSFSGVVRDHDGGRAVLRLEYEIHSTAEAVVREVAADIAAMEGIVAVAVTHRYGSLAIGDVALAAAVSAAHRREAFDACARLVDEVKHRIPIWKRQVFADGTDEWVGSA